MYLHAEDAGISFHRMNISTAQNQLPAIFAAGVKVIEMKISTTITKNFFEMKMQDLKEHGFFIEYKEVKPFWKKRLDNLLKEYDLRVYGFLGKLPEMVFLVGSEPHRYYIENIFYTKIIPEKYASAIKTDYAYAIKCVEQIARREA